MGQCEELENKIKTDYGDDYLKKLKAAPELMPTALKVIVSYGCEDYFKYDDIISEFCAKPENVFSSIGGTRSCKEFDTDGSKVSTWCLGKDDGKVRMRTRTDACNKTNLMGNYESTAIKYCNENPKDPWCSCYNVSKGICASNMDASGCKNSIGNLDANKKYFKDGYDILKANAHCRPGVCNRPERAFVPSGTLNDCKDSYRFCDKDIDIRSMSNSDIVLKCNLGMKASELPEWWDDEDEDSDWWLGGDRKPPFDKYPLNQLPITEIPEEFDWEDDNVKYLTYGGVGFCVICCCCLLIMLMIMSNLKKK